MNNTSRAKSIIILISLILLFSAVACDDFLLYDVIRVNNRSMPTTIYPVVAAIFVQETQNFSASGGSGDYVYSVHGAGSGSIDPLSGVYTAPDTSGTYTVVVTDTLGESAEASVFVMLPQNLTISPDSITINEGSSYTFSATGGRQPYTFSLSSGDGSVTPSGLYTSPNPLVTGSATVRVTDANLSQQFASVTIVATGGPLTISPANPDPVIDEHGSVAFTGSGGVLGYTFELLTGGVGTLVGNVYSPQGAVGLDLATIRLTDSDSPASQVQTNVDVLPASPTNLYADGTVGGPQAIQLSWVDNSDVETEYKIERTNLITPAVDYLIAGANAESYLDSGLSPSDRYSYRVIAVSGTLESIPSSAYEAESNP